MFTCTAILNFVTANQSEKIEPLCSAAALCEGYYSPKLFPTSDFLSEVESSSYQRSKFIV
jgi:hypothetical protein